MTTLKEAVSRAKRLARTYKKTYFVVWEAGEYEVADEFDLDTWFVGISDRNILFCTAD